MSVITEEQVLILEANPRFQQLTKQFVRDRSTYLAGQNGETGNTAGLSAIIWAKERFIGAGITLHPNNQNYQDWVSQFSMLLKGLDVWVAPADPLPEGTTEADPTIDAMIGSGKFTQLAEQTFLLRSTVIEF